MIRLTLLILAAVDFIWLRSAWGKLTGGGKFVDGMGATLTKFAEKNPYPWFKSFLEGTAIPNSNLFGNLTMYGEILTGLALATSITYLLFRPANKLVLSLLLLGLLGGTFLNLIFWLGGGWTSASTDSINLLMLLIQTITAVYIIYSFIQRRF